MQISVRNIIPNDNIDFNFIEVHVSFCDDADSPYCNADITVFIEKTNLTLSDLKSQAIDRARQFLSQCVQVH